MKHIALFCLFLIVTLVALPKTIAKSFGSRIISGTEAEQGQFPWQVAIYIERNSSLPSTEFCGGSIISKEWILTARQCINKASSVKVIAGISKLDDPGQQTINAGELVLSNRFDASPSARSDIALIKLEQPLVFNENVKAIRISDDPIYEYDFDVTVSGWTSAESDENPVSKPLSFVQLRIIDNLECIQKITFDLLDGEMVCAVSEPHQNGIPCVGDTGGAVVRDAKTNPQLIAVISFYSDNGCESGEPTVFTRVSHFRDWIREASGI